MNLSVPIPKIRRKRARTRPTGHESDGYFTLTLSDIMKDLDPGWTRSVPESKPQGDTK